MSRILPGIHALEQHFERLRDGPEDYRPEGCPHCGKAGIWRHGHYERKAARGEGVAFSLGPAKIPRFFCPHCRHTCSRLPACIAPNRQYLWKVQQVVLTRLLAGVSMRRVSRELLPSRRTLGRWWHRLKARFEVHALYLRSRFPELGRSVSLQAFWADCFERMRLCEAMSWLERDDVVVP